MKFFFFHVFHYIEIRISIKSNDSAEGKIANPGA